MPSRVALVTGASSGIGAMAARRLRQRGFTVYGAARRTDRLAGLAAEGIHELELDVTDEASVVAAIERIRVEQGRIDVLVNNAGYGSYGALEDVPMSEGRAQIEVNVFGLAQLTQLVLPMMRRQRSGRVINISSMGGRLATPLGVWYHASKFAVEGFSDALRLELHRFGVHVVLIEPGSIRTEWGSIAADKLRETSGRGAYAEQAAAMATSLENSSQPDARMTSGPEVVADAIVKAATARRPRTRYKVGFGAVPLIAMRRMLPDRMFDAFITRSSGVPR
jgi:short-subunit dehydrogenase